MRVINRHDNIGFNDEIVFTYSIEEADRTNNRDSVTTGQRSVERGKSTSSSEDVQIEVPYLASVNILIVVRENDLGGNDTIGTVMRIYDYSELRSMLPPSGSTISDSWTIREDNALYEVRFTLKASSP